MIEGITWDSFTPGFPRGWGWSEDCLTIGVGEF